MNRRKFLLLTGLFGTSAIAGIGTHGWAARGATDKGNNQRLIVILLRGGIDGLSVVVPHWEKAYYDARPKIAIAPPGQDKGALDLDGRFGLHPSLTSLMPLWKQGSLTFVHACGSPDSTRSHFDAQDYMETGTPGVKKTSDGWMNRLLGIVRTSRPLQALALGSTSPLILKGRMPFANVPLGSNRAVRRSLPIERQKLETDFDQLYSANDSLGTTYQQARAARQQLLTNLEQEMMNANKDAPQPGGFVADTRQLARLMVKDPSIQLAFLALGGWDTHASQAHPLERNLKSLGEGLSALAQGLGGVYSNTTILVMSEFGRTFRENGNAGTDHGHGNVMWLLGGKVKGGKVYGDWPGLAQSQLFEGRDLAVTTDFREVISSVLSRQMQLNDSKINTVFPGYSFKNKLQLV